ncbi:ATP-dependent DNA helicase UvrD2 [Actinotignum urinale]|uniref:DNA 3'-5' helicase n=1 Tax=Actinotignum urinale TaxID=190146 RepID=A0ABU5G6W6_9ACTO|nr:ATP-dependent DNA helicase UvrD2 [Actinotignum urinale]MDY5132868.1 ATP-dependent DNA helicase UvrD2 [Actinotignum urinale]
MRHHKENVAHNTARVKHDGEAVEHTETYARTPEKILELLDEDQRKVATSLTGAVCVRAGAGTGKTRAITHRIAYGVHTRTYNPHNLLAVTFTTKAASEMRARLRSLGISGVSAQTFHSAALRQLRYFWPTAIGGNIPMIRDSKIPLVSQACGALNLPTDKLNVRDFTAEIEWAKVSLIGSDTYPDIARRMGREHIAGFSYDEIAQLMDAYEDVKLEQNVLDFDDILLVLCGILYERKDIAESVRAQYRHFVVDEFQDVSPLQHQLLQLWLGGRKDICVVGDVSQTIYSFAGASSSYLANFVEEYPGAKIIELTRDYRSTPEIVDIANKVIEDDGSKGAVHLVSMRSSGPELSYIQAATEDEEAEIITNHVRDMKNKGVPLSSIAILYRTNAQSARYEKALHDAGITYQVQGAESFFSRKEVREAMATIRAASRSGVQEPLGSAVRTILRSLGWREKAPENAGAVREQWEARTAILELARDLEKQGMNIAAFSAELQERADTKNPPTMDGVILSTLHAAKGLEWDTVFLAGLHEGLMPISLAKGEEGIAEERRLFYVGITRAQTRLFFSYATTGHNGTQRKISRFLEPYWNQSTKSTRKKAQTLVRQRCKDEETRDFAERFPEHVALLEELIEWRLLRSREEKVPAYRILPQVSVREIAVIRPSNYEGLLKVRGLGEKRIAKYGREILEIVRHFENT